MKNIISLGVLLLFLLFSCQNNENNNENKTVNNDSIIAKKQNIEDKSDSSVIQENNETLTQENSTDNKKIKQTVKLTSWNDTENKKRIIKFVSEVTNPDSKSFIPESDRIACFDNDGTLWPEKPTYFQIEFVLDRITEMYKNHPEWEKNKLYKTAIAHDLKKLREKYGIKGLNKLMATALSGMTTSEYEEIVHNWIMTAKHRETGILYKDMAYKPMIEFVDYLKANGFKIYMVSGGGTNFIRVWAEDVYGIPKENILGSLSRLKYEKIDGKPVLMRLPEITFTNDKENKVVSIYQSIGRKPVIAVGNSDGDLQMLEWCSSNAYKSLPMLIHHTDSIREWSYDRNSRVGRLDKALDEAIGKNWLVVDMKNDWKVIYNNP